MPTDAEKIKELEEKIALYEKPGSAALFFAINRKMNEIASLLNAVSLKGLDIAAKSDASFERVFKLLEKSEGISNAAKALGEFAGAGDEDKFVQRVRRMVSPETIAQDLGDYKTQDV